VAGTVSAIAHDMPNGARGLMADVMAGVRGGTPPDRVLEERVRSRIGHVVSHPGSIEVCAHGGRVTLAGPILAAEVDDLVNEVSEVRGVIEIVDDLDIDEEPDNVLGLQGEGSTPVGGDRPLSTPARLGLIVTGGWLARQGSKQHGMVRLGLSGVGLGLLVRGLTNRRWSRVLSRGRTGIVIQKTITVYAPLDAVFAFWSRFENFPRFMSHVREVTDLGQGRSHWVVSGPAGIPVEWDAELTQFAPGELLQWETLPGSSIEHTGIVRFEPTENGGTRIDIKMSYNPPAGVIGHGVAALLGEDPKGVMDDDLVRFKSLLETGQTKGRDERVTLEELSESL